MTDERWAEVTGHIKDTFPVLEENSETYDDTQETIAWIVFTSPLGKVKLERTSRALVLGKKAIGSRRIGSVAHVEYEYSPTEKTHSVKAYRWNDADASWQSVDIEPSMFTS